MELIKLPLACTVHYCSDFMDTLGADQLFHQIRENYDLSDTVVQVVNGPTITMDTGRCIFADADIVDEDTLPPGFDRPHHWPPALRALKQRIEMLTGREYSVCVGIYYKNGHADVRYHQDLRAYGDTSSIASISLGQPRTFSLRRLDSPAEVHNIVLPHGSLIVMGEHCQERYEHAILVEPEIDQPRLNLTFRAFERRLQR